MRRADVVQVICDLIGFAKIVAARLGASQSAEVALSATDDESGTQLVELWGHAPLLYKPLAGSEALYVELGDERVVLATKDRRWQIAVSDGEVVVRAMGKGSPAYVKLTPGGEAEVHASAINLGGAATGFVALDGLVRSAITAAIAGHTHGGVTTGAGATTGGLLGPPVLSTASTKVKAE